MDSNHTGPPERLRLMLIIAVVGAALALVGWYRFRPISEPAGLTASHGYEP